MLIVQLIIIQVVTFVVLVFVLRKLLFAEANTEVKRLQNLNEENEKKAEELKKKAEARELEYKERLKKDEENARRIKEDAEKEIEKQHSQAVERAKIEAEKIISQARNSKEKMREEVKNELEEKAVSFACELVKGVFDEKIYKNAHSELIDNIIHGLENIDESKISDKVKSAELTTPFPISAEETQRIKNIITKKASRQIDLKEKMDKGLIAGVIIKIGDLIIDGSLSNKLEETRVRLRKGE